jgi:pyruvate dehydrogenase E2 component (dihydrolipoamide acetyltransferase)
VSEVSQPITSGTKGGVTTQEPDRAARSVARRSAESRATVPDLELSAEARIADPAAVTTAALVRASARALRAVPRANAAYRDGKFELYGRINVGVIVATEDMFAIPTIFDADEKGTAEITEELERLTARAASRELVAPETSGATFTVWHPGLDGVAQATPLVIPPQAAALAAGAVRDVPVTHDGVIVPGHILTLTLACDHRILYGPPASRLLGMIKRMIEEGTR